MKLLAEEFAVGATSQQQEIAVANLVDQQPIRLNMAFAATRMVADKQMISHARDEWLFGCQVIDDQT